ncbi:MAG: phosphate ABC transporter permease subunit PstC, partial [Acidocella sp. 20-57-95]
MQLKPFRISVLSLSLMIPAALCAVVLFLAIYSAQAVSFNGVDFVSGITWDLGSVVFGLWGIAVLIPLMANYIGPGLSAVLGFIPFFAGGTSGSGYGLLTTSIVLALMITPIIATTLLDALLQVPKENRESAFALGATHFEVVSKAMMPMVRSTLIGGIVLALGRALGETMAVLMVSGGAINIMPQNI